ncbi:biliverdin-producing heme oxygenase [Pseudomonas sp. GD03842]|uniref:biliverdin-producing heme oxygenase n=1 Tax=Pseudomonas sp. GD03842 TaxID=2975385 RepID=UPI002449A555|nr:biliverdin-producing heme oxygenase [Pseudomonas sp. GD03842]MDH0747779.1 biliverdin-producing heme oxygenase [Pseudomonas sp. GD03842]
MSAYSNVYPHSLDIPPLVEALHPLSSSLVCAPPVSVLQQLRIATAVQHKALEARLPLTHPDLDRQTYVRILEAYYGFHAPLQLRIDAFLGADAREPEREKVATLIRDLHALGLSDADISRLPVCADLPPLDHVGHLFGIQYVMEGATLGGQVLRRLIFGRLGIEAENGAAFLDVYGRDTGRLWKAFLDRLAELDHPDVNPKVVQAACATFACFEQWLARAGVLR